MALEDLTGPAKFINALNPSWPVDDDFVDEGDNHIRGIKNVLVNTFPNINGPVTVSDEQINAVATPRQAPANKIINGRFQVNQRFGGSGVLVGVGGVYGPDRFFGTAVGGGTFTLANAPDSARPGEFYLSATPIAADASLAAGDVYNLGHWVEGFHVADLNFGSANAEPFTLAFEASCTIAGTFPVSFRSSGAGGTRSYIKTFTLGVGISQLVVMTIPGDIAGTWDKTNGLGLLISFGLGIGSTFHAPAANAWTAGNFVGVAGCTNLMAVGGGAQALFIRDLRLYAGNVDYGPDTRLYAEELALCQRYFYRLGGTGAVSSPLMGVNSASSQLDFQLVAPMPMRAVPVVITGTWSWAAAAPAGSQVGAVSGGTFISSTHVSITPSVLNFDGAVRAGLMRLTGAGGAFGGSVGAPVLLFMGSTATIDLTAEI